MPNHTIFNERPESQERAIKVLEKLGYQYIPRSRAEALRGRLSNVLFPEVLREFLHRQSFVYRGKQTPFSDRSIGKAINDIDVSLVSGLMPASKTIYDMLLSGNSYEEELFDGGRQSFDLKFIDWEHPENNIWQVTDEFSVERTNGRYARPDIVLLVNGIPLVVIECKKSSIDVEKGVAQNIRNWQPGYIPQLFKYAQIIMAVNPNAVKYGTCGTPFEHFSIWREKDYKWQQEKCNNASPDGKVTEQDRAVVSMLSGDRLLELIRYFILYDSNVKKIARYQQFFGIQAAMKRIKGEDDKSTRSGVIWHTQGSGKSLTMVMLVKKIIADPDIREPRFVLVNDRINLDKQLRDNFAKTQLNPARAKTGKGLIGLLNDKGETIITTLVHKFDAAAKKRVKIKDDNIFLLVDESHRTHSGELHDFMVDVLPNATRIGFTGTPLLKKHKFNTYAQFGPLIDTYPIIRAVEDGVIVPLVYEGRIIPQDVTSEKIDDYLKYIIAPLNPERQEDMKRKWSRFLPLAQTRQRIDMVAFDVHEHFMRYARPKGFKAMIAASSRPTAIDLHKSIRILGGVKTAVVISPESVKEDDELNSQNKEKIKAFFKEEVEPLFGNNYEEYADWAKNSFIGGDEVDILIVKDMLLTGFDAPVAAVLYVDKPMREHSLLQAIARVNRVYPGKDFGLIVDYWGIFSKLNTAMDMYSDEKSGMDGYDQADIENTVQGAGEQKLKLEKAHQELWYIFEGKDFDRNSSEGWQSVLAEKELRKIFYERLSIFSRLLDLAMGSYALYSAIGYDQIQKYKQDLLHFQKLRGALLLRYNEKVDFSKYEDGIRSLLNNFVLSEPGQIIVEPVSIHDTEGMKEQLEKLDGKAAKGDAIRTRMDRELETCRYDDPLLYKRFSQQVKETLEEYKAARNDDAYLFKMEKMADDFKRGYTGHHYPACIDNDSDAKAFYGTIQGVIGEVINDVPPEMDEVMGQLAIEVKKAISSRAKVDWRHNVAVHRDMEQALDDLIWDFTEEYAIKLPVDKIDLMLEGLKKTAISRY
ncbi:type I restriction-modification system restriction subunit R [Desulfocucumis palustris]|uniref:Type I restriction enzyme endonuclease subunit n=1 Tax=Desulfocucumis palustris TaxID=1898651 RepID=A0A2L2XHI8_9FIRM|nr:type I restriction endonuclease subunit R [Desulfocucumis palustris]GBF33331.1 type I restriction-modification system restriction subunit R [Desulfocucumis palustris]